MQPKPQAIDDGFLVIFEGIDGSGKTTQLELAQAKLAQLDWSQLYATRNLGGTPIGEALRQVILSPLTRPTETNLYISVAIQEALAVEIQAQRAKQSLILMDRGPLSLAAYEVYGSGLDATLGWEHVTSGMQKLRPELTIVYQADVKTALQRARQKAGKTDYFESKPASYFEKVAAGYAAAAERYADQVVIIDAEQPVEEVHMQTMDAILQALAQKLQA
jgi:dTMP kinase